MTKEKLESHGKEVFRQAGHASDRTAPDCQENEAAERLLIEQIDPASLDPERTVYLSGHRDRVLAELRRRHLAGKSMLPSDIHVEDAALFLSATDTFPSYHVAVLRAGVPMRGERDMTRDGIVAELTRRYRAGQSVKARDVEQSDRVLYTSVRRIFGRWGFALSAAGISWPEQGSERSIEATQDVTPAPEKRPVPQPVSGDAAFSRESDAVAPTSKPSNETPVRKRQYVRWTEEKLLAHIREAAVTSNSLLPKDMFGPKAARMVQYCKDKFGGYSEALQSAGLNAQPVDSVPDAAPPPKEDRDKLMKTIAKFVEEPWDQESIAQFRRKWGRRVKTVFGGWSQVAAELNIPEWKLSPDRLSYLSANPDLLLDLLRDRQEAGEQVDSASIHQEDRELWQAVMHCFGAFNVALREIA